MVEQTDCEVLAREWIRAIRGKRSQRALSAHLGYRSNVLYRWETGRAHASASTVLAAMDRLGWNVAECIRRFYGGDCPWVERMAPASREGTAHLLDDLRGDLSIQQIARGSGFTRFQITRWLQSTNEPRLSEWLWLIETITHRLLDFIAAFFGNDVLPTIRRTYARLVATREAAYDHPESHVVLRALELERYQHLEHHEPGFIAEQVGLSVRQEQQSLELLAAAGQIRYVSGKWQATDEPFVDTRADAARSRKLRAHWLRVAAEALEAGNTGTFGYNLFSISAADLDKARQLHRNYYREMAELIHASHPSEKVVLFSAQLFELGPHDRVDPGPASTPKRGEQR